MDMLNSKLNAKPFLKWAGGKGQLIEKLDFFLPDRLNAEEFTYIEPFVGGGAMLFHITNKFRNIRKVVVNDINENLIKAYTTIKNNPAGLINILGEMEKDYVGLEEADRKEMYLEVRDRFNQPTADDVMNTARMMFLNKTCFNGLYRVNSKGMFNVPHGRYKNPTICNAEAIMSDSKVLNHCDVELMNGDFEATISHIDRKGLTFIYFDPPYRPLNDTSSFTSYSKDDFNDSDQIRLANYCKEISSDNCLWMLSNSDCSAKNPSDRFFENLYAGFSIERVVAKRSINANPHKRGSLTELLIHNE